MAGPTGLGLDHGAADYLLVTNTGTATANALAFTAEPVGSGAFLLRLKPDRFNLPAGAQASWSLVRARGINPAGGSSLGVSAEWFDNGVERHETWVVLID